LATKEFKEQTDDLEADDLEVTYECLKTWEESNEATRSQKLFAFFNSGEHSGASQPHRHIQFLPVESILEGYGSEGMTAQLAALLGSAPGITSQS
jgi:sulfate adenylyltransferase (ADP) / ATP adenylyltransferase